MLGRGMNLQKIRSSRPRKAKTARAVTTSVHPNETSSTCQSHTKAAGAQRTATIVAERRSARHWSFSARCSSGAASPGGRTASSAVLIWAV